MMNDKSLSEYMEVVDRTYKLDTVKARVRLLYSREVGGQACVDSDRILIDKYHGVWGKSCAEESITRAGRYWRSRGFFVRGVDARRRSGLQQKLYVEVFGR